MSREVPEEERLTTHREQFLRSLDEGSSAFYCINCGKIDGKTRAGSILCWDCTEADDAVRWTGDEL